MLLTRAQYPSARYMSLVVDEKKAVRCLLLGLFPSDNMTVTVNRKGSPECVFR